MKIRLWSDIHTEFGAMKFTPRDDDNETVLVIAGDFQVGDRSFDLLRDLCPRFKAVLYTAGNHEYYHHKVHQVDRLFMDLTDEIPNFHYLNPGVAYIDDVRFVGATLWSDMNMRDPIVMQFMKYYINDFRKITWKYGEDAYGKLTPNVVTILNTEHRLYIEKELTKPFKGKTVVFTHFPPLEVSHQLSSYAHDTGPSMYYYMNTKFEDTVVLADYWFHGHSHEWFDYDFYGCRIIARPRGYIGHDRDAYSYDLSNKDADIIEV